MRDAPYGVTTEAEARSYVRELAAKKPDFLKIWVDDRNGSVQNLTPNLYRAIIDEAHRHKLRVMAHVFVDGEKDLAPLVGKKNPRPAGRSSLQKFTASVNLRSRAD
jgi:hypothetical protein